MKASRFSFPASLIFALAALAVAAAVLAAAGSRTAFAARSDSALQAQNQKVPLPTITTEALPPGASAQPVLSNMVNPVAMAFDPQGRLFYTEKSTGNVRLFANGMLQPNPVINFTVDSNGERGLLGITLDPSFSSNHYIYVYYTCGNCATPENRVVRFTEGNGTGSNPVTIFTSPQIATNHVGGNIHFGPDGKLYITIGDSGCCPQYSQDVNARQGKIHRINPDGSIPADNPVFTQTGTMTATYAMGLRNSFDFTFDPLDTTPPYRIFASENGPGCDDEVNRIEPGYNYGWRPSYPCDDPSPSPQYNTIPPLWYVPNGVCCVAPTGIHIYTGSSIPQWQNSLFMCSYNDGVLRHFYLSPDRQNTYIVATVSGVTCNMDIETGPDGAFYYIQGGGYSAGTLMRIAGSGPTPAPTATGTTSPPSSTPAATDTPGPSPTPGGCSIQFTDVPPGSPFYTWIECLACRGIVAGYPDGTFRPNNSVTRGQVSKMVDLAASLPPPNQGQTFEDVPQNNPFWGYVEALAVRGIVGGYRCGGPGEPCIPPANRPYFRPNANVTRGQLSRIVALAAQLPPPNQGQAFEDVPQSNPFWQYVQPLADAGAIGGYRCGGPGEPCVPPANRPYFRPNANVTRGQSSKIVSSVFFPSCTGARSR